MKILYIHEYFTDKEKNGANIVAFTSYYLFLQNQHECFFYSTDEKPFIENQFINDLFPVSHINKKGFINKIFYRVNSIFNFNSQQNLEKILKLVKPDLVHIHSLLELSFSVILSLKKYSIPYVITAHDAGFACPVMGTKYQTCTLCSENILNCIKHKCSRNNIFCSLYVAIRFMISKFLINCYHPQKILCPSLALKNYIEKTNYSKNNEIQCIYNSLDKNFSNIIPNFDNKGYFLFVGNLIDIKGVDILLSAIKDLPRSIQFHIVGDGLQKEKYEKFIIENKLENVSLCGKKNRLELIEEYKNCIAIITPSVCFEIFGMINIEAFSNGKPVIASKIGGIPEIVEHNVNGLLFEPGNVEQLKDCILKYWNNLELVIKHGKNGYKKVSTNFSQESYYENLLKIYESVIYEVN